MSSYLTNVALAIKGDRVEKGTEIELTDEEAAIFDPADITPMNAIPAPQVDQVVDLALIPLDELSYEQLKSRAKDLELSASGSKADLQERIRLHIEAQAPTPQTVDHVVTEEDLEKNADLVAEGVQVGDVIQVPAADAITNN